MASNKDRDMLAFGKVALSANGAEAGPIKIVAERSDAELDSFRINEQGTTAALLWNIAGHYELAFVDLATDETTPGPQLPAELAGGLEFSPNGKLLAMTVSGSTAPADVWVMRMATKQFRQITHAPHAGVTLVELVRPKLVRYNSFDGLPLRAWLYCRTTTARAVRWY